MSTATSDRVSTLGDYFSVLRRRWVYPVTIIPAALLLAVFLAYSLPAKFESSATIMLEASSIPATLIQTTVISAADQQIELIRQRVMTPESAKALVAKVDPYPNETDLSIGEKAQMIAGDTTVERVDPVTLQPIPISNAFTISYLNTNPATAAKVTREIANLFLEFNQKTRTDAASEAYRFLNDKATQLDKQIREVEGRIADFKGRHADAMPEQKTRNQSDLEQRLRDADNLSAQVRMNEQKESLLQLQVNSVSPTLVGAASDWRTQLAKLQSDLADAKLRYTPNHPTIQRLERAIQEFAASHAQTGPQTVVPDNPEYLQLSTQLAAVRAEKQAAQNTLARTQMQIADLQQRLEQSPVVEREYAELDRDHQLAVGEYDAIQTKLRQADIARQLEAEGGGEKLTLIRAPYAAKWPSSPNRIGIILLGIVLGAGIGIGLAALVDSSDPTVRGTQDVLELTALPALGGLPVILNGVDRRRRLRLWGSVAAAFLVFTALTAVVVYRATDQEQQEVTAAASSSAT